MGRFVGFRSSRGASLAVSVLVLAGCAGTSANAGAPRVQGAATHSTPSAHGKTRTYFIAADEVQWDYAPAGKNLITGKAFGAQENTFVKQGRHRIGHVYTKSLYREYTGASFTTIKPRPPQWQHLGTLGPLIQAEVGDTIVVHFRNNTPFPASVHPHGVFYEKDSEGAPYADGTHGADKSDDAVPTGGSHTYVWQVPERAGPGPADGSSVMWMYHSHTDEVADTYAGLVGAMVITGRGMARADGSPKDVDRQFVTMFEVSDENQSPWLQHNVDTYAGDPAGVNPDDEEFGESNLMHSINGYVYGGLPGLVMHRGDRVRWYVMGMGTEVDLHTPHWHGNSAVSMGMRTDVVQVLPGSMVVANMQPDNPGTWLYHCHVNDHITAGMIALYTVE